MGMYVQKPGYVIGQAITGADYNSPPIWISSLNQVNFQISWIGLTSGTLNLWGSNKELLGTGNISYAQPIPNNLPPGYVPQPPTQEAFYPYPLGPMPLAAAITISAAPGSAFFDVVTSAGWVWIEYIGTGTGVLSIAFSGKADGS